MFNPVEETEEDWQLEIESDVKDECSKFGGVLHCHVEKDTMVRTIFLRSDRLSTSFKGEVFLKFESVDAATRAITALNGRWFAGRQIGASYVPEVTYVQRYPEAA